VLNNSTLAKDLDRQFGDVPVGMRKMLLFLNAIHGFAGNRRGQLHLHRGGETARCLCRFLVALPALRDLLLCAKHLLVEAISRVSQPFSEPEIDHFVMAITAAEAIVRHTTPYQTASGSRVDWAGELRCARTRHARARHVCLPLPPL
jgi:hypothetical protein